MTQAKRSILVFLAFAYALSVALSLLIGCTGGHHSRWIGFGYGSMFIPTLSVLLTRAVVSDTPPSIGWERFPLRYVPLALLLMPLVMHATMLPAAAALHRLQWQDWLTPAADGLFHTPAERGWGVLTPAGLAVRLAFNAIVGVVVVSILALFEEIGWRGWLLPQLIGPLSRRRAVVLTSAIWALWHVPYIVAGILQVDGVPARWTALVAPIGIFGSGLVIGWMWLRTESVWITALAHGALNNWGQYAFKFTATEGQPRDVLLLAAGGFALVALGSILLLRETSPDPMQR